MKVSVVVVFIAPKKKPQKNTFGSVAYTHGSREHEPIIRRKHRNDRRIWLERSFLTGADSSFVLGAYIVFDCGVYGGARDQAAEARLPIRNSWLVGRLTVRSSFHSLRAGTGICQIQGLKRGRSTFAGARKDSPSLG